MPASMEVAVKWDALSDGERVLSKLVGVSENAARALTGLKGVIVGLPSVERVAGLTDAIKGVTSELRSASVQAGNLTTRLDRANVSAQTLSNTLKGLPNINNNSGGGNGGGGSKPSGVAASTGAKLVEAEAALQKMEAAGTGTALELRDLRVQVAKLRASYKREEELLSPATKPTKEMRAEDLIKGAYTKLSALDAKEARLHEIQDPEQRLLAGEEIRRQRYLAERSIHLDTERHKDREGNLRAPGMLESFRGLEAAIGALLSGNIVGAVGKVIDLTGIGRVQGLAPGGLNVAQKAASGFAYGLGPDPSAGGSATPRGLGSLYEEQRRRRLLEDGHLETTGFGERPDYLSAGLRQIPGIGKALAGIAGRRTRSGAVLGSIADAGFDLAGIAGNATPAAAGLSAAAGEAAAGSAALAGISAVALPVGVALLALGAGAKLAEGGIKFLIAGVAEASRLVVGVTQATFASGSTAGTIGALGAFGYDTDQAAGVARGVRNAVSANGNPMAQLAGQRVGIGVQTPEGIGLVDEGALAVKALQGLRRNFERDSAMVGDHTAVMRAERDARLLGLEASLYTLRMSDGALANLTEHQQRLSALMDGDTESGRRNQRAAAEFQGAIKGLSLETDRLKTDVFMQIAPAFSDVIRGASNVAANFDGVVAPAMALAGDALRQFVDTSTHGMGTALWDWLKSQGNPQSAQNAQAAATQAQIKALDDNTAALRDGLHGGGLRAAGAINAPGQLSWEHDQAQRRRFRYSSGGV